MSFPSSNTLLTLSGVGIPPYSARGLQQTLTPIEGASQLRRTVNGALRDFSGAQFRKFASSISGEDVAPPAANGVWPGRLVTVGCIVEIAQAYPGGSEEVLTEATDMDLDRPPVAGSLRWEEGFIFYRPSLVMRVVAFTIAKREWEAAVPWSLDLEEV